MNKKEIQKVVDGTISFRKEFEMYDEHSKKMVMVTHKMQEELAVIENRIFQATNTVTALYWEVYNRRLYLAAECSDFVEYLQKKGHGRSTAFNYKKLIGHFSSESNAQIDADYEDKAKELISKIGYAKSMILANYTNDQIDNLVTTGFLENETGGSISIDEMAAMSRDEVRDRIYQVVNNVDDAKLADIKREKEKYRADLKFKEEENKTLKEQVKDLKKIKDTYSKQISSEADLRDAIKTATEYLHLLNTTLTKIKITEETSEETARMYAGLYGTYQNATEGHLIRFQNNLSEYGYME